MNNSACGIPTEAELEYAKGPSVVVAVVYDRHIKIPMPDGISIEQTLIIQYPLYETRKNVNY